MDNVVHLLKPPTIELFTETRRIQRQLIDSLTAAERETLGTSDHWSAKDLVTHVTFWTEASVRSQQAFLAGEAPPDTEDFQTHNERVFAAHRELPWPEVLAAYDAVFDAQLQLLEHYSEDQLAGSDGLPDSNRPLWARISGNCQHTLFHFSEHYLERGRYAEAIAIQRFSLENSQKVADPRASGYAAYNLACLHARLGQTAEALSLLPSALQKAPDLLEWSKTDPDLSSLHGQPDYEALYA